MTEDRPNPEKAKEISDDVSLSSTPSPAEDSKGTILYPKHSSFPNIENKDECLDECLAFEINVKNARLDEGNLENCIEIISATIPSIDLNCDGCCLETSSQALQPLCPYNLRSQDNKPIPMSSMGGIDPSTSQSQPGKKRGRKSKLSMAQVQEKFDVVDRKQQSITGALRAVQSPVSVLK